VGDMSAPPADLPLSVRRCPSVRPRGPRRRFRRPHPRRRR
jgi:hypothetical protein